MKFVSDISDLPFPETVSVYYGKDGENTDQKSGVCFSEKIGDFTKYFIKFVSSEIYHPHEHINIKTKSQAFVPVTIDCFDLYLSFLAKKTGISYAATNREYSKTQ